MRGFLSVERGRPARKGTTVRFALACEDRVLSCVRNAGGTPALHRGSLLWRHGRTDAGEVVHVGGAVGPGDCETVARGADREIACVGGHVQHVNTHGVVALPEP